jgi:hypothetical protein
MIAPKLAEAAKMRKIFFVELASLLLNLYIFKER